MLFGPQNHKELRNPYPDCGQAMETGVAGGADCDQAVGFVDRALAVMNM